jgi:hypothetical protein
MLPHGDSPSGNYRGLDRERDLRLCPGPSDHDRYRWYRPIGILLAARRRISVQHRMFIRLRLYSSSCALLV